MLFMLFSFSLLTAYASTKSELEREIEHVDNVFFEAFNECDVETMSTMFSEELEFYHDTAGLGDYQSNMKATKALCERKLGLVRTLVPGSMEIYPIKDFGAVQKGEHKFCHTIDNKEDCGVFGFMHIWKQTEKSWVIHRVVSYGH